MARAKEDFSKPTHTVIGKDLTIQAALFKGSESVRIDGTVIGNFELDGTLLISETGHIEGNIHTSSALIAGKVTGDILCRSTLHLASTAVICGNVTTAQIIVDEGASLHGLCRTRNAENDSDPDSVVV